MVKMYQERYNSTSIIQDSVCIDYFFQQSVQSRLSYLQTFQLLTTGHFLILTAFCIAMWAVVVFVTSVLPSKLLRGRRSSSADPVTVDGTSVAGLPPATRPVEDTTPAVELQLIPATTTTTAPSNNDGDDDDDDDMGLPATLVTMPDPPGGLRALSPLRSRYINHEPDQSAVVKRLQRELLDMADELRAERQKNVSLRKVLNDNMDGKLFIARCKVCVVLVITVLLLTGLWNAPERKYTYAEMATLMHFVQQGAWYLQNQGWTFQWVIAQAACFAYAMRDDFNLVLYHLPKCGHKFYSAYEGDRLVTSILVGDRSRMLM